MDQKKSYIRRLMVATSCIQGTYEAWAKESHMKHNTLLLLYALNDGKKHTQKSICDEWMLPRTTLNTIIKDCEAQGYLTLQPVPGKKREMEILLTPKGALYEQTATAEVGRGELEAIEKTLQTCSPSFIADLEYFSTCLRKALHQQEDTLDEH